MILNQEDIHYYKSLPKLIQGKPKLKVKNQKSHTEQDFTLLSEDGEHIFLVFMRQNVQLPNNFSIGLRLKTEDGSILLCRYNGKHGEHKDKQGKPIHWPHIHTCNPESNDGTLAIETDQYISFQEAQLQFFQDMNITNYAIYFPDLEGLANNLFIN